MAELDDQWKTVGGDKLLQVLGGQLLGEGDALLVKGLEEGNAVLGDLEGGGDGRVVDDGERSLVIVGGHLEEDLGVGVVLRGEVAHDDHLLLLIITECSGRLSGGKLFGRRAGLLLHPVDDLVGGAAAAVLHHLPIVPELQSGVAADFKLLGEISLLGGVHLAEQQRGALLGELRGRLGELGGERLAVAAPGSV